MMKNKIIKIYLILTIIITTINIYPIYAYDWYQEETIQRLAYESDPSKDPNAWQPIIDNSSSTKDKSKKIQHKAAIAAIHNPVTTYLYLNFPPTAKHPATIKMTIGKKYCTTCKKLALVSPPLINMVIILQLKVKFSIVAL